MGWGGIANLPPDFDVFGGQRPPPNIVDDAIRHQVKGLSPAHESMFADLKRNLLHQDYARYFDSCLGCARVLAIIEDGKYTPEILRDIVQPALATAVAQMEAIRADVDRAVTTRRRMLYEPETTLDQFYLHARPLVTEYPQADGASTFEGRYRQVVDGVRAAFEAHPEVRPAT
jgi:hypothetical protein